MAQSESPAMFKKEEYTTYNGVNVTCYIGDITQAAADGIVTGQGWDLTKPGLVTEALCASAQIPPQDFSKIIIGLHKSKHLDRGDTCCLSPQEHHIRLKFKTVIMAGVLHFKDAQNIDEWKHKMESLYIKVLNKANEERLESVALPLLGSGTAEVPLSLAAEALVAALLKFRTKCLSKVFVVLSDGNTHGEIIKQLENYFTAESGPKSKTESTRQPHSYLDKHKVDTKGGNVLGKGNSNQEVNSKEAEDHFYRGKDNSVGVLESQKIFNKEKYTTNNGVDIICYVGDITQAVADGIVTGQGWDLTKPGLVTEALCASAKIPPADFSKIIIGLHKSKYLERGDTFCLSPREHHIRLKFKTVIMAGVLHFKDAWNKNEWKHKMENLYIKVLNKANDERLESVALPLLGCGTAEVPLSLAAEALVAALLKFRTKCLSKVFVVSTGGNTHGEIIKQLENVFTAKSGPRNKTESTRQPHSYLDKHKVDTKEGNVLGKGDSKEAEDHFYRGKDNSVGVLESPEMFKKEEYTTYNGVDVTCYVGDITQAAADGIVTGQVWDLTKRGALTKQLCDSAQIDPADFSKIIIGLHKSKYLETGDICCLSPRQCNIKLKFKTVIMAGVFNIKNAQNIDQWKHEMESLYIKILNTANEERLESVALPVLGSGTPEVPLSAAAEALVAALLKYITKCLSKVFVVSTGGKAHGETIKQLENYFTAESGPKSKTESTRQPHSYLDQYKVDGEKGNFNTNKGEDNYDEGEDISDKGEDNNDEGENNSNKGKGNYNEGEDISDKGENNINSRKHKNDQECDNSDKEDDNSYQSENNMNSRKENYDHEEDNINLRKDRSYEGESCTNSGKDNSYKGENCTNSGKDMYQSGQHQKEQLTAVNPEVLFDQLRNPPLEKHPLPAADKTPEDADDDCMLQEAPTPVAMAETSAGKLRKLKTPALMLSHLEKKVNTEATWMENEFKLRQEELEIRKEEVKNERMRIQLLQAEQQNRFKIEEERKNEEREERRQIFDRFGKMTDALLSLMQKYDLK